MILAAYMLGEAIVRGLRSQAAVLAGPTADPAKWHRRAVLIAKAATYADALSPEAARLQALLEDNRDEPHPGWVLRDWDYQAREHLGHASDDPRTLRDARAYLNQHLTRLAHDETFAFEELARDLKACRSHCESVLHDDEQTERGAPCPTCSKPMERLVSFDGSTTDDGVLVAFACSRCTAVVNEHDYLRDVRARLLIKADMLNADDMAVRINVPASTIRRWASKHTTQEDGEEAIEHEPLLRSCARIRGRKVYRVEDAERIRDTGGDTRGRNSGAHVPHAVP